MSFVAFTRYRDIAYIIQTNTTISFDQKFFPTEVCCGIRIVVIHQNEHVGEAKQNEHHCEEIVAT